MSLPLRVRDITAGAFLALCLAGLGTADEPGSGTPEEPGSAATEVLVKARKLVENLIPRLGDPEFSAREEAERQIFQIGDPAMSVLAENRNHADPEVRRRIRKLMTSIKWSIPPLLHEKLAGVMSDYEGKDWQTRQTICIDLGVTGKDKIIPTLLAIIKNDPSESVRWTAIATLYKLGDVGIGALAEAGVDTDRLEPHYVEIFISLGNRYLTEGKYGKAEREYVKALKASPRNSIAAYNMACAYSLRKELEKSLDWLEKSVEYGFDDFKWMREDPDLKNLHDLPRFSEILRRRGKRLQDQAPAELPPEFLELSE